MRRYRLRSCAATILLCLGALPELAALEIEGDQRPDYLDLRVRPVLPEEFDHMNVDTGEDGRWDPENPAGLRGVARAGPRLTFPLALADPAAELRPT